jgi:hypothetical protein
MSGKKLDTRQLVLIECMRGIPSATTRYNTTDINNKWKIWDTTWEDATPFRVQILMVKTQTHALLGPVSKNTEAKEAEHNFPLFW